MSRLKRPLNRAAVQAADDQFYANHPELVKDGRRQPLDPDDPEQAALRKEWTELYLTNGGEQEERGVRPKEPAAPVQPCLKSWVKFQVIHDETDQPVESIPLKVKLPDGRQASYSSGPDGMIEIDGIPPGTCEVTSDLTGARMNSTYDSVSAGGGEPSEAESHRAFGPHIAEIEIHRVKTGETLEGIARSGGTTWQQLAEFNWGTSSPDDINKCLRDDVGCTRKTADGRSYRFDDSDDPGIVAVPRVWIQTGLVTEQTHRFRIKPQPGLRLWIRLDVDPADASTDDDRFVLVSTDGSYRVEKTVRDDLVSGDQHVDLRYSGMRRDKSYTLEVYSSKDAEPEALFEDVPYDELAGLSPASGAEDEEEPVEEDIPLPDEHDLYPDESGSDLDEELIAETGDSA